MCFECIYRLELLSRRENFDVGRGYRCLQSVATPDAPQDGSSRLDHPGPASSSWCRRGTLIPGMMRDGDLHHFDLGLLVVGLDADQVWMYDLGSVVRDLHG